MHRYCMEDRSRIVRCGFWLLPAPDPDPGALLWLPAGIVAQAAARFGPVAAGFAEPGEALAAAVPLAIACRRMWRLRYRRAVWLAGTRLGTLTVAVAVFAGLLGPLVVAGCAVVLSLPVWIAWRWLARPRIGVRGRHG